MTANKTDYSIYLVQLLFFTLVLAFLFVVFNGLASLSLAFVLAFSLAFILSPLVNFFESIGLPRISGVLVTLALFFLSMYLIVTILYPYISRELNIILAPRNIQIYEQRLLLLSQSMQQNLSGYLPDSVLQKLQYDALLLRIQKTAQSMLPQDASFLGDLITLLLIAPVLLVILLLQGDQIYKRIMSMVPNRYFEMVISLVYAIRTQSRKYLKGLGLQWLIFGSIFSVALWIGGVPYAGILGFVAASCNIIPYIGPVLGLVPALFLAIIEPSVSISSVLISIGITQLIDNTFTQPVILAGSVKLHPVIAILTLITLQQYFGIIGMVIAIPFASIIMVSIQILYKQLKAFGVI